MARGGKRKGAGRPTGSKNKSLKGWIKISTSISPNMYTFLESMKKKGFKKSEIVNSALKLFKKNQ